MSLSCKKVMESQLREHVLENCKNMARTIIEKGRRKQKEEMEKAALTTNETVLVWFYMKVWEVTALSAALQ